MTYVSLQDLAASKAAEIERTSLDRADLFKDLSGIVAGEYDIKLSDRVQHLKSTLDRTNQYDQAVLQHVADMMEQSYHRGSVRRASDETRAEWKSAIDSVKSKAAQFAANDLESHLQNSTNRKDIYSGIAERRENATDFKHPARQQTIAYKVDEVPVAKPEPVKSPVKSYAPPTLSVPSISASTSDVIARIGPEYDGEQNRERPAAGYATRTIGLPFMKVAAKTAAVVALATSVAVMSSCSRGADSNDEAKETPIIKPGGPIPPAQPPIVVVPEEPKVEEPEVEEPKLVEPKVEEPTVERPVAERPNGIPVIEAPEPTYEKLSKFGDDPVKVASLFKQAYLADRIPDRLYSQVFIMDSRGINLQPSVFDGQILRPSGVPYTPQIASVHRVGNVNEIPANQIRSYLFDVGERPDAIIAQDGAFDIGHLITRPGEVSSDEFNNDFPRWFTKKTGAGTEVGEVIANEMEQALFGDTAEPTPLDELVHRINQVNNGLQLVVDNPSDSHWMQTPLRYEDPDAYKKVKVIGTAGTFAKLNDINDNVLSPQGLDMGDRQ